MIMEAFDPSQFGFVPLRNFQLPGGVRVFEYANHPSVDGAHDFLRLNLYLSKDGNYVTIWNGLLDPIATEVKLQAAHIETPPEFDLHSSHDEALFKGHIESTETATHIFKALRIEKTRGRYALPQVLSAGTDKKLRCDLMEAVA